MRYLFHILLIAGALSACQTSPEKEGPTPLRPEVPRPLVNEDITEEILPLPLPRHHRTAVALYQDILDHPWIQSQPDVPQINPAMVADIRSLPPESQNITSALTRLQHCLDPFDFFFPPQLYSILNIPAVNPNVYASPVPFQVYKRLYLGETGVGFPIFVDLRLFDLDPQNDPEALDIQVQSIIAWHLKSLQNPQTSFEKFTAGDRLILVGRGARNTHHLNNTHGFFTQDRGVFTAFALRGSRLAALHIDAPWEHVEENLPLLKAMVNRPMARLPDDACLHVTSG